MQDHYLLDPSGSLAFSHDSSYSGKSNLLHGYLGGLAGLFMDSVLHPMDTVRTRIKTNVFESVKLSDQFKLLYRQEGLSSYFRGFSCTLGGSFIANGAFFFAYEKLKSKLKNLEMLHSDVAPFFAAFAGGLLCNSIYMPFIAVRTRMQLNSSFYEYRNVFDGLQKVVKHEGFRKLYSGGPAFFVQTALDLGLTFGFYEIIYKGLKLISPKSSDSNLFLSMVSSVGAASLAATIVNPFDVLVARMQTMHSSVLGPCSLPSMIRRIYDHEGFGGFMKGVTGTMLHYSMAALILFPTYETLKEMYGVDEDV